MRVLKSGLSIDLGGVFVSGFFSGFFVVVLFSATTGGLVIGGVLPGVGLPPLFVLGVSMRWVDGLTVGVLTTSGCSLQGMGLSAEALSSKMLPLYGNKLGVL